MARLAVAGAGNASITGVNLTWTVIAAITALLALSVAGRLVREILGVGLGTVRMQEIALRCRKGRQPT